MTCRIGLLLCLLCSMGIGKVNAAPAPPTVIVCDKGCTPLEKRAAKEVRRYVYLRTGKLLPLLLPGGRVVDPSKPMIVVSTKDHMRPATTQPDAEMAKLIAEAERLQPQQYLLKTWTYDDTTMLWVVGGDPLGALYGAYRLAEHLGVRFYLHGDVVPDERVALEMPVLNETGKPLFDLRGIQPFHDFPEGPDWWNRDTYKAVLGQLPKLRMNFFGLHSYPECNIGPEPFVWIGRPSDLTPDGRVKQSHPARHFTTVNANGGWGSRSTKTGDYAFGAAELFDRDDYGADYMRGTPPWSLGATEPDKIMSPEQCNALFTRTGEMLNDVFGLARRLGVKTCIGTETPLTIPAVVKQRLQAEGKNPNDPAVVQDVYEGMFRRIAKTFPLDYYWLWTNEGWTWSAVTQQQIDGVMSDFRAALAAARKIGAPFTLATCGWVLGPPQSPALFDKSLPKEMPMACINRTVGNTPVEPGFAQVGGRPKWAIPWMEDDPGMTMPQLWAGRMRRDAADALAYGCTGLMGIHWRTRILGPNVAALAKAAWDQTGWNKNVRQTAGTETKWPEGVEGGEVAQFPNNRFAGADHETLYQTVRYGMSVYRIDVPNGTYRVTLKLAEPFYGEKGRRVFGTKVQGKTLFEHLDMFAAVGQNRTIDKTANDVRVCDGRLTIEFLPETEFPCIAGIVIESKTAGSNQFPSAAYTRKINCGGPAFQDFQADLHPTGPAARLRYLPVDDFYADWARAEFGAKAAKAAGALFTRLDGHLPRPADWVTGPGSIRPDPRPWNEARKQYAFVDEMESLRPLVEGPGNLERYEYWLGNFRYLRSIAEVDCTWARLNAAMEQVKAEKDREAQRKLARNVALPLRKQLVAAFAELHRHLLATVGTPGELGNVSNWQQQSMPVLLTAPGRELAKLLGEPLPPDAMPSKQYAGPPRLFVREVRTGIVAGEKLTLTVVVMGRHPESPTLYWRPLGTGRFAAVPLAHVARGVYTVTLPAEATKGDFEYYIEVAADGRQLAFPPGGAALPQTVVVE